MKDTKHIKQNFHSVAWIMPQGWDLGALGAPKKSKQFFFKHGHVAYQIDGDDEQNRKQVIFILGSNWWPWGEVKRSNIVKFRLPYQFQRFSYQTLCVFSQIKENILNRNFILLLGSCPRGGTWACWGSNFSAGICDGAPSTAHSSGKFHLCQSTC